MTKITVETATLADAIGKAARVAPTKGAAYDKAAGILWEIDPDKPSHIYIKATDLEVTYVQRVAVLHVEADAKDFWRTPALAANVIGNLPLGIGSELTIERIGPFELSLKCGRKKGKLRTVDPISFPRIGVFDPAGMGKVEQFPTRLSQAAWATDPDSEILCGVHMDGETMISCDRQRMVIVPCKVPVDRPITVPLRTISPVIRNAGTVDVRVEGDRFQVMPDQDTQITSCVLAAAYPNARGIIREKFDGTVLVEREPLLDSIQKMLVMVKAERYPRLLVTLRETDIHLKVLEEKTGEMEDTLDCEGGPTDEFTLEFSPDTLTNALSVSTRAKVSIDYGGDIGRAGITPNMLPIHFYDDGGFDSWLMPLRPM